VSHSEPQTKGKIPPTAAQTDRTSGMTLGSGLHYPESGIIKKTSATVRVSTKHHTSTAVEAWCQAARSGLACLSGFDVNSPQTVFLTRTIDPSYLRTNRSRVGMTMGSGLHYPRSGITKKKIRNLFVSPVIFCLLTNL
jgi:hypothetical protein